MTLSLAPEFQSRVRRNEPLARHTSWHVGGPAELFFSPRDRSDLTAFMRALHDDLPIHFIGMGSNLLVRDGGLSGMVICTRGTLDRFDRLSQTVLYGEAGLPCATLARQCVKWGLGSAAFFAGIPGTLGGALAMNAGAFGGETWPHVVQVETLDRRGRVRRRTAADYQVGYREVLPVNNATSEEWFLAAQLTFEARDEGSEDRVRELLERRRASQPIGEWSCGSVFRNPAGLHAARLIEEAGLKGFAIGDAVVSSKHANFFINRGAARAVDFERLIEHVQAVVEQRHGVLLTPEVRIIGNAEPVLS